jgi:hypothetical protein
MDVGHNGLLTAASVFGDCLFNGLFKETIAELLLMDDDTLLVNEELLKGLDEELDSFLKELLEK